MTYEAVTTCSAQGWQEYGCRMVATYREFWPASVPLVLYSEGMIRNEQPRSMPPWLFAFRERHARSPKARGYPVGSYNYRFDAIRFAYKTAAVIDTLERSTADTMIWIDADTVTHAPVSEGFLDELAPTGSEALSWLNRAKNYPECGFYMMQRQHPAIKALLRHWKELYLHDTLFHLPEWHDSYVLAELVKLLQVPWKSISGAGIATGHPFINGPLGAVMDHLKGPRKGYGKSKLHDLKVKRNEAYWRNAT
jgi:hypothetical protein